MTSELNALDAGTAGVSGLLFFVLGGASCWFAMVVLLKMLELVRRFGVAIVAVVGVITIVRSLDALPIQPCIEYGKVFGAAFAARLRAEVQAKQHDLHIATVTAWLSSFFPAAPA